MHKYVILHNPGHNHVYFEESKKLSKAELAIALSALGLNDQVSSEMYGGIYYLTFTSEAVLTVSDLAVLSRLSFVYALFEMVDSGLLKPVSLPDYAYINQDIGTILRYTGKTNELFTRMMINVAVLSSANKEFSSRRLFDPVAGKGTTLFEGLVYGMDVYGMEVGDKAAAEGCRFLQRYLQTERYKFSMRTQRVSGENRSFNASRTTFSISKNREAEKRGETKAFELVSGNSAYADKLFKKSSFDLIVGDLPYGVQHGSVTGEGQTSLTRDAGRLLDACLPAWKNVLKKGGTMALAFNLFTLPREKAVKIVSDAGFHVLSGGAYDDFAHRVDQSITRDIIFAVRE